MNQGYIRVRQQRKAFLRWCSMRMMLLKTPSTKVRPQCPLTERLVIMRQEDCSWTSPAHVSKQNPSGLPQEIGDTSRAGVQGYFGGSGPCCTYSHWRILTRGIVCSFSSCVGRVQSGGWGLSGGNWSIPVQGPSLTLKLTSDQKERGLVPGWAGPIANGDEDSQVMGMF